jgi:uncharacterized protein YndB with AHSA1/START domain
VTGCDAASPTAQDFPSAVHRLLDEGYGARSTPERVWHALTDSELSVKDWGNSNVSDWQAGSSWEHRRTDGSGIADVVGTVLETVPPRHRVITFAGPGEERAEGPSRVTFDIEPHGEIVRFTVTQENLVDQAEFDAASAGWPAVLANLKSLMETGHVLQQPPLETHAELRAADGAERPSVTNAQARPVSACCSRRR